MAKNRFTLVTRFNFIAEVAEEAVRDALEDSGNQTIEEIRRLVPVDTGDLRDSYMKEIDQNGSRVTMLIGSNPERGVYRRGHPTEYAPFVEFGTSRSSAQPHFLPAMVNFDLLFPEALKQRLKVRLARTGSVR
ncbi:MAG: HK97-gp10 family putative phage morphogenesis protein [Ilumatobacteraceae bacterium]